MTCTETGCTRVVRSLGWCRKHTDHERATNSRRYRQRRLELWPPQCGTRARYRKGCRCSSCTKAETTYRRKYRKANR